MTDNQKTAREILRRRMIAVQAKIDRDWERLIFLLEARTSEGPVAEAVSRTIHEELTAQQVVPRAEGSPPPPHVLILECARLGFLRAMGIIQEREEEKEST